MYYSCVPESATPEHVTCVQIMYRTNYCSRASVYLTQYIICDSSFTFTSNTLISLIIAAN